MFLIKPIIWVVALLIWAALSKKHKQQILYAAVGLLLFFSNGALLGTVMNAYEAGYPERRHYDVGIVLGGFSGLNKRNNKIAFSGAGDRLFQAVSLFKSNQIDKILVASGSANLLDNEVKEADLVINYLKLIGIPDSALLVENQSRNTVENARNSIGLIGKVKPDAKILVITSAWHIPRAKMIFDRQSKHKIEYYPTNFAGPDQIDFADFIIPSASALGGWEMLFKEWIGLAVDRLRS
ncbi:YdcF family protein [Pedobacter sp. BMA]|uniref:YdcF family protein n=1 Tax=Pedobacter sp. BMA TaxID=1663685 RepID=UPI0018CD91A7|nr:YdcF family protein [Pedobacter sp. BMA]